MKTLLKTIVVFMSLISTVAVGVYPKSVQVPSFVGYVQDEFVVEVNASASDVLATPQVQNQAFSGITAFESLQQQFQVSRVKRQFRRSLGTVATSSTEKKLSRCYKIHFNRGTLTEAMAAFANHPLINHVEPIGVHAVALIPNDPSYQNPPADYAFDQWNFWAPYGIDAQAAWDVESGSEQVVVAILDTGVRYFHTDLGGSWPSWAPWDPNNPHADGNIWINPCEIPGNGIDDDGNGYIDDTLGWDFVDVDSSSAPCFDQDCNRPDNDPDDGNGHGTHVAGIVAAITNNDNMVSGIAGGWSDGTVYSRANGVKIMPLRIGYHANYRGYLVGFVRMDWAAEAMDYVATQVERGVNITAVNCSWGSSDSGGLSVAVDNLLAHDVVVVVAAGNNDSSSPDYLGSRGDCLDVAATDSLGNGLFWDNYGSWVDVAAPGVDIVSTYRDPYDPDPYAQHIKVLSGTSMAAPHVAGIAALLESYCPTLTGPQKVQCIVSNVIPYNDSRDLGSGIANAKLALDAIKRSIEDLASADVAILGLVRGSYSDTYASDNIYQAITETKTYDWPENHYRSLEHKWTINVTGGACVTFYLEAYQSASRDGDNFVFSYSIDNTSYTDMLTVTKTSDDDSLDSYILPSSTRGTVYIRVRDTDRTDKNNKKDTIYVDQMYIESAMTTEG